MTETWVPEAGQYVQVMDNSYSNCAERALIGQVGVVQMIYDLQHESWGMRSRHILVIQFKVVEGVKPSNEKKTHFKEYFDLSRGAYLYFQPVGIGAPKPPSSRPSKSGNRGGK